MVERYANRFDAVSLTFVEVAAGCLVFLVIAVAGLPVRRQPAGASASPAAPRSSPES
jgi:hypothetical protein